MMWSPSSWRTLPIKQQPTYKDAAALEAALAEIRRLPPLVTPEEVDALRARLAEVARGERFLVQGGDCAERFMDCAPEPIEKKLKILLQMSLVLTWGARMPTLRIARMAGQFAKPRSKETESLADGREVPAFRGDNVNSFDLSSREPDPARLVLGYFHSAATLNYARAALASGLADLEAASHWDLGFVQDEGHRQQYKSMVDRILSALDFMRVCGVSDEAALHTAPVYMSHEGLQVNYEEALTRLSRAPPFAASMAGGGVARPLALSSAEASIEAGTGGSGAALAAVPSGAAAAPISPPLLASSASAITPSSAALAFAAADAAWYNLGTHFLWIGDRTRQLDHAHVEYFRGIMNPVGIKCGPSSDAAELVALIRRLWGPEPCPSRAPGKIVLITRMGAGAVRAKLPGLIRAVQAGGFSAPVVWTCDPMHGNTKVSGNGYKTREFDDILAELKHTFEVHREEGSHLGGVHFELTGENVTECTGGPQKLLESDLPHRYTTYCDPRLNYAQGMELSFLIAQHLAGEGALGLKRIPSVSAPAVAVA